MEVDRDDLTQPPPAKRPRLLSLESLPEAPVASYAQDGTETLDSEESPNEKFWKLVKLVDFSAQEDTKPSETTATTAATSTKPTQEWTWTNFQTNIQSAAREVESVLALVDWLRENKNITTMRIAKPELPARVQNTEFVASVASRRAQLSRSHQMLEAAAERLRGAVARADLFHDQIMELRKIWRVVVPEKQPLGGYQTTYFVDISYMQDGFRSRVPYIPIQKSPSGDIMIEHAPNLPFSYIAVSASDTVDQDLLFPVNRSIKAVGVKQCHEYLCSIQQSIWNNLVFKQTARELQTLSAEASDVAVSESHITLQLPGIDEQIHFRLARRADTGPKPDNAMEEDDSPVATTLPALVSLSTSDGPTVSWTAKWLAMTLECSLQRNLQLSLTECLRKDSLYTFSSHQLMNSLQSEDSGLLAKALRETAQHLAMTERIAHELDKIRKTVGSVLGPCRVRWLPTGHHLVASWDFEYAVRFVEIITLKESRITVQSLRQLSTPTELARYLLRAICKYVIVQLSKQLRAVLGSAAVSKKGLTLRFPLTASQSHATLSLFPEDYGINISLVEQPDNTAEDEETILSWKDLPGGNHLEKITSLVLRRGLTDKMVKSN